MRDWVRALTFAGVSPNLGQLGAALEVNPDTGFPSSRCQVNSAANQPQGTKAMIGVHRDTWKILYGHVPMGTFKAAYLRDVPTSKAQA
jgi:hypothetical protein